MSDPDDPRLLKAVLDIDGDDFLETGLTFHEWVRSGQFKRWKNSISCLDNREEELRRLRLIRRLCVAMHDVERDFGPFNFRAIDYGILAIINGDWKECRYCADGLLYADEDPASVAAIVKAHAPLRALLLEACDLAPAEAGEERH